MKRLIIGTSFLLAAILMFTGCEPLLLYNTELPNFKAPADKALCVILRPIAITGSNPVNVYLDGKYKGATEGNTVLSFEVDPGEHYIIGDATNTSKVKYNFKPNKVYFIFHTVVTISQTIAYAHITIVTSTFAPMDGASAMSKIEEERGKIKWVQPNPNNMQEDMDDDDFEEIKEDYAKWAKKEPEDYLKEAEYPGY